MKMATDAIHRRVELLAFANSVGAVFVTILRGGRSRSPTGMEIAHRRERQLVGRWRLNSKAALLTLAAREPNNEEVTEDKIWKPGNQEGPAKSFSWVPGFQIHFAAATSFGESATRGTPYPSRMASICLRLRCRTASISSCNGLSPLRTPIAMLKANGRFGSAAGETGTTSSGTEACFAKYPANGPQTTATSTSPFTTASTIRAGGFGSR